MREFGRWLEAISIHEALASLDRTLVIDTIDWAISIHEALASLDLKVWLQAASGGNFDPRGSCEPRQ